MRLIDVLDTVNQIEKSSFLKILDGFCSEIRKSDPKVDQILSVGDGQLKNVDEKLKETLNTSRNKIDLIINLGNKNVIIAECKTKKDSDYNQYTALSRQLKSYENLCEKQGYLISKILLVANDFSDEFVSECEYDYELNLSLITSKGLIQILEGFNRSLRDKVIYQM
ncbi:MAG: hypothetical protein KJ908_02865 [Acidobacteria bacterium]|nr:hypothetical protein [Acidobacteriota bacterium]